eukprot:1858048-Karenia_brevis.AAC.1
MLPWHRGLSIHALAILWPSGQVTGSHSFFGAVVGGVLSKLVLRRPWGLSWDFCDTSPGDL